MHTYRRQFTPRFLVLIAFVTMSLFGVADPTMAATVKTRAERTVEATTSVADAGSASTSAYTSWEAAWNSRSQIVLKQWFEANTGPKVPLTKRTVGAYKVDSQAAATALIGRIVTGRVLITIGNVTVRDFKVLSDGSATSAVDVKGGLKGVVLQDFEVDGRGLLSTTAAVGGGSWANVTVRRAHVHHSLDGVRLFEGSTYENLYVEQATANANYVPGATTQHADAVQVVRAAPGKHIHVRRSWLDHGASGSNVSSAVLIKSDAGRIEGVTLEHSYVNGGRYTVIVEAGAHGAPLGIAIRNNRFGRDYQYGVWSGAGVDSGSAYDRTGNVWADSGAPITLRWGLLR